tara:strand:+ start:32 stop:382 length:351 start_codon:yes stop_codon:yes gene_type:complete
VPITEGSDVVEKKTKMQKASEVKTIKQKFDAEANQKEDAARDAWVATLIPAVGSAAFFSSMLVNVMRTYSRHGFPTHAFSLTDKMLIAIPVVITGIALYEGFSKIEEEQANGEKAS